ncbi:hypothetical protein LTR91_019647 [Friedmanniomyces endolithicus]|uniref:Cytochrome P450 monooxygenase FUM15 n=1 Tax=Friedmanniomyces endolithicus TaxID=329885 RepID=A0AAN6FNM1_9PEZI|nr:hypothetical protein LTS00_014593 [Friedmanniomyces endolithicus]KAK0319976.1 hypothetical protein LTR82_008911 [Friedmanniomyces endolithicus]KAK0919339.1 hypothetical protein LTR57_010907 [Friedmanniomyces endolithicus]KAK0961971.1 hypothetical protein LTR91_019647 [Friedmanniomyces endolithicus]KAK1007419.1 hypothetical protein LTS01_002647 [Friedmanniomyces endolithicus]
MSTPKGVAFMALLAVSPPALAITGFLLSWNIVLNSPLAVQTLCILLHGYTLYRTVIPYFTSPLRRLPSPKGATFLMGHAIESLRAVPPGAAQLKWSKEVPNDGVFVFQGFFHAYQNVMVTSPEAIMDVVNTHAADWEKPSDGRAFLRRILGDGLVVVEGNEHREQRKNVTPAFAGRVIKDLVPLFWIKGLSLVEAAKREASANEGVIEMNALASRATLDIIGSAGLGKDFSTLEDADHEIAQLYSSIMDPKKGSLVLLFIFHQLLPIWLAPRLPIEANRRLDKAVSGIRRITKDLLAEKSQSVKERSVEQRDIIATLMRSGKFTDDALVDQLLTFLAAGHETTAAALGWATYLVAKHADVQDRLRSECQNVCGRLDPDEITAELIDSMPYLDAACNEVLRLYPPVPGTARHCIRETHIAGHVIPKGTFVVISPWAINRSTSLWGADAEEFRPDRWLGTEGKDGHASSPYAFTTFLHGPRSCIGSAFARYELKCLLATLLMHTAIRLKKPDEAPVPAGAITIKPGSGLELILTDA